MEDSTQDIPVNLFSCGHGMHLECTKGFLKHQLNNKKVKTEDIACLECRKPISQRTIETHLSFKDKQRLFHF